MNHPTAYDIYCEFMKNETGCVPYGALKNIDHLEEGLRKMAEAIIHDSPLRSLRSYFADKPVPEGTLRPVIDDAFIERLTEEINRRI